MEEALVSIIIPIYNVEKYLDHCLDTIKKQTYKNIEVLLVNDNSPDNSASIAKKYVEEDNRFHYYEKENGGLGSARNYGIDRATGDYISFVDSDDWVEETFIEHLVVAIQKDDADIAICNMKYVYADETERKNVPQIKEEKTVTNIEGLADLFNSRYYRNHAQNKLYKRSLFLDTGIRYAVGKLYEDVFTTYKLFYKARKLTYIPKQLYDYLQARPGSILNSGFSDRQLDIFEAIDCIHAFINDKGLYDVLKNDYYQLAISNVLSLANFVYPSYQKISKSAKKKIKGLFKNTVTRFDVKQYYACTNLALSQKIRYYLILHGFCVYCFIMKAIRK